MAQVYSKDLGELVQTVSSEGRSGLQSLTRNLTDLAVQASAAVASMAEEDALKSKEELALRKERDLLLSRSKDKESWVLGAEGPIHPNHPEGEASARPTRHDQNDDKDDDEESSGFEEGTLLHTLDTMAEKAESYLGKLGSGLTTGVSSLLEKAVTILPPDSDSPVKRPNRIPKDRVAALKALARATEATYSTDYSALNPSLGVTQEVAERFTAYKSQFDVESKQQDIASLLRDEPEVTRLLTLLGTFFFSLSTNLFSLYKPKKQKTQVSV